jgi:hypothetical protein
MARIGKQTISLTNRIVGNVSVDGGAIRGEGGPIRPQLIVPLTIEMSQQPEESSLAVLSIDARLATDQHASPQQTLCQPIFQSLLDGLPARSFPSGTADQTIQLRFFLTPAEVEDIEQRRHAQGSDVFQLYLNVGLVVAAVKAYNNLTPGEAADPTPWKMQYGVFWQVMPFRTTSVSPLSIQIEQSTWVRDVLPGLGYDRLRLLELAFPPPLPDHGSAAAEFDRAKRALDERRYGDCIQACRGLLNMWEKHYGATQKKRVAEVIAAQRGWAEDDIRRSLLDTLWKEVGDISNAPHHPEGDTDSELLTRSDARLVLILTGALSEYVALT